jgi:hypothetical protein
MRNLPLSAAAFLVLIATAYAGGMGDPSAILRQNNAICDAQRRGERPRYPDMCLPELPPDPPPPAARAKVK